MWIQEHVHTIINSDTMHQFQISTLNGDMFGMDHT